MDHFIWIHRISKVASLLYTDISNDFYSNCREIAKGAPYDYSRRLVQLYLFYLLPIFIDTLHDYEFISYKAGN